jgi:hypothetical protein
LGAVTMRVQPSSISVGEQQIVTVDVYLDAGANPVDAVDCAMSYNSSYLEGRSITPGPTLPQTIGSTYISGGTVQYHRSVYIGDPPVTGTFRLFSLEFRALQPIASTPLQFTAYVVAGGGTGHTVSPQSGTVTILANTLTPTPSNTPIATAVPRPSSTPTLAPGVGEIVLRQGTNGYGGFEDTFIDVWAPAVNYQNNPTYVSLLKLRSNGAKRILFRADLADVGLPAGAVIDAAYLTLYPVTDGDYAVLARAYDVLKDWDVDATTWISATHSADCCSWARPARRASSFSRRQSTPPRGCGRG